jgi:FkbM family methyltransferase
MDGSVALCKQKRTVIQAGTHMGHWAQKLSNSFERVYTFEPDPLIFECARLNIEKWGKENIFRGKYALGPDFGEVKYKQHVSAGSGCIDPDKGEPVQQVTIDSLGLEDVDMIVLDIERYEIAALRGALQTIKKCSPVIHVEVLKGEDEQMKNFMTSIGYEEKINIGRDRAFVKTL